MRKSSFMKMLCILFIFCVMTTVASLAQTFTSLASFDHTNGNNPEYVSLVQGLDCADGSLPFAAPVQGADGNFYGTTEGDPANLGTVFK